MAKKKPSQKALAGLCHQVDSEDGIDPRDTPRTRRMRSDERKDRQLCSQVADTLAVVFSGVCSDDVLQAIQVVSVQPAPNATQLLVTVQAGLPGETLDPDVVREHLARASGMLRAEVTAAITRKRAPKLIFAVL